MITHLLAASPELRIGAALGLPAAAVLRAWFSYRTTVVKERGRNRRLDSAIGGTAPDQRPEILRAVGELESAATPAKPGDSPHPPPSGTASLLGATGPSAEGVPVHHRHAVRVAPPPESDG